MFTTLAHKATMLRRGSLQATTAAGSGHPTSCLSAADIVSVLMFHAMRYDVAQPYSLHNDQLIFSKGHAAPLLYAAWWQAGALTEKELLTLRKIDSDLEGHPTPRFAYVSCATGSLGNGLSIAVGSALAARMDKRDTRFYVLLGDSECAEGSVWEAAQLGAYYKTDRVIAVVDMNRLGQRGETMYGHNTQVLEQKFKAFGWNTYVVDGHNLAELTQAVDAAKAHTGVPSLIIARTHKGQGVSFLQDQTDWHGKALTQEQLQKALQELPIIEDISVKKVTIKQTVVAVAQENKELLGAEKFLLEVSTRQAYGMALAALGKKAKKVVALDAEVKNSTYSYLFEDQFPDRFVECFIAEQNMVNMAIGFTTQGFIPFVSTFACFFTRAFDQLRMAAIGKNPLRLVGSHAGISVGPDGPSQMGLEDMAMISALPRGVILYPSDAYSCAQLVQAMVHHTDSISYLRTTREALPNLSKTGDTICIGGSRIVWDAPTTKVTIVAAGVTVHEALGAAADLRSHGIEVTVIDAYSVQPLDVVTIMSSVEKTDNRVVVVEDHYPVGGLGTAVQEYLIDDAYDCIHLCVRDIPRSGTPQELRALAGIDAQGIKQAVLAML